MTMIRIGRIIAKLEDYCYTARIEYSLVVTLYINCGSILAIKFLTGNKFSYYDQRRKKTFP